MNLDEQAKKRLLVGLSIAAFIALAFGYWRYMILKMTYQKWDNTQKELKAQIDDLKERRLEINTAAQYREQIKKKRDIVQKTAERLPDTEDAVGFYQELINILRITGVQTNRVDPREKRGRTLYTEIPYGISANCRYHEFGQFLNLIEENQKRFMRVNSFNISNNQNRPSIHPVNVEISTFMFNKPAE